MTKMLKNSILLQSVSTLLSPIVGYAELLLFEIKLSRLSINRCIVNSYSREVLTSTKFQALDKEHPENKRRKTNHTQKCKLSTEV